MLRCEADMLPALALAALLLLQTGSDVTPAAAAPAPGLATEASGLAADAPLPDARLLVERLLANQDRVDELLASYTFKARETEYDVKRGPHDAQLKPQHTSLYQIYPS